MLFNCWVWENSWESLGQQEDQTSQSWRKSVLNIPWQDWCWSWNSYTLATWCKERLIGKTLWCSESLKAGGERDDRGWNGWMVSPTQWTWVWLNSGNLWWTERPVVLQSMWLPRVGHNWVTKLNWDSYLLESRLLHKAASNAVKINFFSTVKIMPQPKEHLIKKIYKKDYMP